MPYPSATGVPVVPLQARSVNWGALAIKPDGEGFRPWNSCQVILSPLNSKATDFWDITYHSWVSGSCCQSAGGSLNGEQGQDAA